MAHGVMAQWGETMAGKVVMLRLRYFFQQSHVPVKSYIIYNCTFKLNGHRLGSVNRGSGGNHSSL